MFAEYSVGYFASHDEGWGEVGGASRSLLCRTLDPLLCLRTPVDNEKVFRENGITNIKKISKFRYFGHYPYFHLADLAPDWTNPGSQLNEHFVPAGWLPSVHLFGLTWETKISKLWDVSTISERPT